MNKRVIALILSAALLCSPCTAYAAEISSTPVIADSGIAVIDSGIVTKSSNKARAAASDGFNFVTSFAPPLKIESMITTWTAPSNGLYKFHVIGAGGDGAGGTNGQSNCQPVVSGSLHTVTVTGAGGGSGGQGGYSIHSISLTAGEKVVIDISSGRTAITVQGVAVTAYCGGMGKAPIPNPNHPEYKQYGYISEGGNGGTASAGNNYNLTGFAGATGQEGSGKAPNKGYANGGNGGNGVQDDNVQKIYQNMAEPDLSIAGRGGVGNSNGGKGNSPAFNSATPYGLGQGGSGGGGGGTRYNAGYYSGDPAEFGGKGAPGGVVIEKSLMQAPTVTQSFNAGTNKSTITASATGATSMKITYGGAVVATASGSSVTYEAAKNGSYTVTASNGSASLFAAISITAIDDVAPVISNTAPAGGWAGSKTTAITLTDAKTPSGMQYNTGGGWVNYSAPFTHTFTANGSITVLARDKWGCTSAGKTITASQIDTTVPTAPSITKSPTTAWHKDNVTMTISGGSDAGSGINRYQYNISGGAWQNYSAPFAVVSSAAVNARTVDNVGLVSSGSNISVNIDRIKPTGIITYNKAWTKYDVILNFTAADFGGSNVAKVRAGNGGWVAGATTAQTVGTNGSYSFAVEDNAGNPQTVTEAVSCVDKVLPVVTEINFIKTSDNLLRLSTLFNKQLEIDIKTSDNASGVATVEYQLVEKGSAVSESAWLPYSATAKPRVAKRFSGTVAARCTDVASNISAVLQADVTTEDTPPTATHTLSTTEWTNGAVNIHLEAMDDLSGVASITLPDGTVVQGDKADYIVSTNGTYRFIVTDKCGNILEYDVVVSNIDLVLPTATHTLTPNAYINQPVEISVTASDDASGIASITLPDGTVVQGNTASYTASANGVYSFVVTDNAGNIYNYEVTVSNLDFIAPIVTGVELTSTNLPLLDTILRMFSPSNFRTQVRIGVTCTDDASGVASVEYQLVEQGNTVSENAWLPYNDENKPIIQNHFVGQVAVRCIDVASTTSNIYYEDVIAEDTPPTAAHTLSTTEPTNGAVNIQLEAMDDASGVATITLPDGTVVQGDKADYIVNTNGTYRFIITDKCGNILEYDVVVSNIDLVSPTATHTLTPSGYTNKPVVIGITASDDASGIASITLPDGTVVQGDTASYTAAANDMYSFIITDKAGNIYNYDVTVNNLDFVAPSVTGFTLRGIKDSPVKSFMRSVFPSFFTTQVELLLTAEDDYSGVDTIEYQVTQRGAVLDSGNWRVYDSGNPPILEKEIDATVAVRTTDHANNVSAVIIKDAVIDGSAPIGSHTLSTTEWCNTYVIIAIKAQDLWTKAKYITLPDGKVVEGDTASFRVVRNGNYEFILADELGTSGSYIVPINNIEEVYPTPPKLGVGDADKPTDEMYVPDDIELGWERNTIDVKSLAQSGIEKYQYKVKLIEKPSPVPQPAPLLTRHSRSASQTQWIDCTGEIIVNDEGVWDVEVRSISYAGNISETSNYVLKNDYNPPTGTAEVTSNEIKFKATDDLSGVKSIACEHDKAITLTLGSEVTCKMAKTETHIYTVTDNAGLVAEIPVEYIRPNDDVNTGGSEVPKDEIFVEGDKPASSIPLPLPQGEPSKDDLAQSGTASDSDTANGTATTTPPNKDASNELENSTSDGTDKSNGGFLSQLADFMRGLLNSFIRLLQKLAAWFNSLPLALRVIISVSWWLLVLLIIYYIYRRVKKTRADKQGE